MFALPRRLMPLLLLLGAAAATKAAPPPPTLSSWDPWQGSQGTLVTLAGRNLQTTSAVFFNGVPAAGFQIKNDYYVKATIPAGATTGKIKIVTQGGSYTTTSDYKITTGGSGSGGGGVTGSPSIASFEPWHGTAGTQILIQGKNLTGASAVLFNGTPATNVQVVSEWKVLATIGDGTTTGKIKITTPAGSYTTSADFIIDGSGGGGGGGGGGGSSSGGWIDPPPIDPPAGSLTGHPRLIIRAVDIPRLRSWANNANPVWPPLLHLATNMKQKMDAGQIGDEGRGGGNVPSPTESYSLMFAFMSLVHPDAAVREDFGSRAYSLIMPIFTEAAKGQADGLPFRGRDFAINNRANWYGEAFPLTIDWIYDRFTAADKAKIRTVFLRWIQENLRANTTGPDHPEPLGVVNDPSLIATKKQVIWASNNYYRNHMRHIGLMSMAMDAADDVPSAVGDPVAGTLRRFLGNATGAWLYQVAQNEKTFEAGGASPEGVGYGELSQRATAIFLLAMNTAGVDNPAVYGNQVAALTTPHWGHQVLDSYLHLQSPAQVIQESWIGPTFLPYQYSDAEIYKNKDYIRVFGSLAIYALNQGDLAGYAKYRWAVDHLPPGGLGARNYRITSSLAGSSITTALFYFLATDPTFVGAVDPRTSLATDYFAPGQGLLLSRTSWSAGASWFTFKCSPVGIDHQFGDGNAVGFWRAGEWLTKPAAGYGENIGSSDSQNTLSIQNPGSTTISFWLKNMAHGSQFMYHPAGDPVALTSTKPDYAFAQGDTTNLYNCPEIGATDVAHASRTALWLKPDVLVLYDRATSKTAGKYKRFCLNTPTLAAVNGSSATVTTQSGQQLFIDALLPANASLAAGTMPNIGTEKAAYEPMQFRFTSEDPTMPQDARFLHVLQGADPNATKQPVSLFQSQSGTPFDGALVATTAVLFKKDLTPAFTAVTFSVPSTITSFIVTGLAPGGSYTATVQSGPDGKLVTVSSGGPLTADAGGVLKF